MRLLPHILGRVYVLDVRFAENGTTVCTVWRCSANGKISAVTDDRPLIAKGIAAVTVGRHGVVTKSAESGIAAKVIADPDTFIWSKADGMLSFVRRDQLTELMEELSAAAIYPLRIECVQTPEEIARATFDALGWKNLFHIGEKSSSIGQAIARRVMIPLLGLCLTLLSINAIIGPRIQSQRQELELRLASLTQSDTKAASVSEERRCVLESFARRLSLGDAEICNRIGRCVPQRVILTELWLEPLTKRMEEGEPLQRRERTATITGIGDSSAEIGLFTQTLVATPPIRNVRLVSVERARGDGLQFRIEVEL